MIEIQTVFTPKPKQKWFIREDGKVSRISQDKWWKLYDKGAKILQPIYEVDSEKEKTLQAIAASLKNLYRRIKITIILNPQLTDKLHDDNLSIGELWEEMAKFCKRRVEDNKLGKDYPVSVRKIQMLSLNTYIKKKKISIKFVQNRKGINKMKPKEVYQTVKELSLPFIENYHKDLLEIDKGIIENNEENIPFLHFTGTMGTHLFMLAPSKHFPAKGEIIKYLFGTANREHILMEVYKSVKWCRTSNRQSLILHFDGTRLFKINQDIAERIARDYVTGIQSEWEKEEWEKI